MLMNLQIIDIPISPLPPHDSNQQPYNSSRYASAYSLTFEDPVTESETDDEADGQPQSSPNIEEQVADSDKADEPQPQLKKLTYKERYENK